MEYSPVHTHASQCSKAEQLYEAAIIAVRMYFHEPFVSIE
jgi:hypothetical protein